MAELSRQTRTFQSQVKAIDEARRMVRVRLSDATRDRMGEVIPLPAWKRPLPASIPINYGHDNSKPAVARGYPELLADGLYANLVFPPAGTYARADLVYDLLKLGILTDVSVEFLGRREGDTYAEAELLAAGVVNIGANPRAQVVARALGFAGGLDGDEAILPLAEEEAVMVLADDASMDEWTVAPADVRAAFREVVAAAVTAEINRRRGRVD